MLVLKKKEVEVSVGVDATVKALDDIVSKYQLVPFSNEEKDIIIGVEADISVLPDYIQTFVSALIKELGNLNETFDRTDFLLACEELYKAIILFK